MEKIKQENEKQK